VLYDAQIGRRQRRGVQAFEFGGEPRGGSVAARLPDGAAAAIDLAHESRGYGFDRAVGVEKVGEDLLSVEHHTFVRMGWGHQLCQQQCCKE
jgi:hypothetical protein